VTAGIVRVKVSMVVRDDKGKKHKMFWDYELDPKAGESASFSSTRPIEAVSFGKKKYKFKPLGVVIHNLQIIKNTKRGKTP